MVDSRLGRTVPAAMLAAALTTVAVMPTSAVVVFEPRREPAPEAWLAEVPVAIEWADVALRIPEEWTARVKREPGVEVNGASLLAAFGPDGSMCMLEYYVADSIETWQDAGVDAAATLTIDGHPAERFDDMLGTGAKTASAYAIDAGELAYGMLGTADQAPADRWLSIAESITVP